jgi:hypothetical protein
MIKLVDCSDWLNIRLGAWFCAQDGSASWMVLHCGWFCIVDGSVGRSTFASGGRALPERKLVRGRRRTVSLTWARGRAITPATSCRGGRIRGWRHVDGESDVGADLVGTEPVDAGLVGTEFAGDSPPLPPRPVASTANS